MNQKNFADDQNPYEYEKPISANKFRRYGSFATMGLLAIGTAFGGSALAATIMATDGSTSTTTSNGASGAVAADTQSLDAAMGVQPLTDANGNVIYNQLSSGSDLGAGPGAGLVVQSNASVDSPLANPIISLPTLAVLDYGNLSSATPYGGSSSGTSASASNWGDDEDGDDDDNDDEDHDDEDGDED